MKESRKLLDHWLAAEGAGAPVACLATTFTFDPDFFEQDCLSRFLGLQTKQGEGNDLSALIEQEEHLAEVPVTAVVDRSYNAEGRSLRWDILAVGVRGGLQHSKTAVLVWENSVRVLVGSANLTPAGYREQVEAGVVLEARRGSEIPAAIFLSLFEGSGGSWAQQREMRPRPVLNGELWRRYAERRSV